MLFRFGTDGIVNVVRCRKRGEVVMGFACVCVCVEGIRARVCGGYLCVRWHGRNYGRKDSGRGRCGFVAVVVWIDIHITHDITI